MMSKIFLWISLVAALIAIGMTICLWFSLPAKPYSAPAGTFVTEQQLQIFFEMPYVTAEWGHHHAEKGISLFDTLDCLTNKFKHHLPCSHTPLQK